MLLIATEFDQVFPPHDLDLCLTEVAVCGRVEIQIVLVAIEVPFTGGIELFENIFHEAVARMRSHLAVVLPAADQFQFAICGLAFDYPMHIAP